MSNRSNPSSWIDGQIGIEIKAENMSGIEMMFCFERLQTFRFKLIPLFDHRFINIHNISDSYQFYTQE